MEAGQRARDVESVADPAPLQGVRIEANGLTRRLPAGTVILHEVSLLVEPGELVAIAGGSGAGKTTLLEALSGVRPADEGSVVFDGLDVYRHLDALRTALGYVPQDDIVHEELPLARSLQYTGKLRLPQAPASEVHTAVDDAMAQLDQAHHAGTRVAALSGGQRKRASIAAELLARPRVFFLDEPTSGLDPATGADLIRLLRRLADAGSTIVITSHAVQDLSLCDRVVFLAPNGHLAFSGSPEEAKSYFGVTAMEQVYEQLATDDAAEWSARWRDRSAAPPRRAPVHTASTPTPARGGAVRQWLVLTGRTAETLARNRLTSAILVGSPVLVVAMFAVLFQAGAFDRDSPSPTAVIMIVFWIAFGVFFCGLTYGLLQIAPSSRSCAESGSSACG